MEPTFRSGYDRRKNNDTLKNDRRADNERRNLINRIEHYSGILEKIPVFKEFKIDQLKRILSISSYKTLEKDEIICKADDESLEIYILISGQLCVTFSDGKEITRIEPPGIVGEMGLFTGDPRSATVVTGKESLVITIKKTEMMILLRQDHELCRILLLNIISELSKKLRHINDIFNKLIHLHVIE